MKQRGISLIELIIVVAVSGILVGSVAFAYEVGIRYQNDVPNSDAALQTEIEFENRLRGLDIKSLRLRLKLVFLRSSDECTTACFETSQQGKEGMHLHCHFVLSSTPKEKFFLRSSSTPAITMI